MMHTDNYPTGKFRTTRRPVAEVDEKLAEALCRPAQSHIVVKVEEMVDSYWESNATSGETHTWIIREYRRETLDGYPL